jgi:hypothetical protein
MLKIKHVSVFDMSDMLRCDGCKVDNLAEDLTPGRGSKVYCRKCRKKQKD